MSSNIVHEYFKKELEGTKIIVKVNPIHLKGTEITVGPQGDVDSRDLEFDEHILEDLKEDGFTQSSAMEFNLYWSGLA